MTTGESRGRLAARPAARDICAVVLTLNEASHLAGCLRTLQWAGERVVVDSGSTDNTSGVAAECGARVLQHDWGGYAAQRNFALTQIAQPWVLFVDADERVPLELAEEIVDSVAASDQSGGPAGFWVPRQNLILNEWVRYAGWYPDYQLRVFRRNSGRYDPERPVHEIVQLNGECGYLEHRLVHHNYVSRMQFWEKQRRYALAEAKALAAKGARAKPHNLVMQPLREFRRRFWTLHGYRSGWLGLELSAALAVATLITYAELWRIGRGVEHRNRIDAR